MNQAVFMQKGQAEVCWVWALTVTVAPELWQERRQGTAQTAQP